MKERPILFSAPMVRAILEGRKTQTRRVLRDSDVRDLWAFAVPMYVTRRDVRSRGMVIGHRDVIVRSPYGYAGDRLWVRETFGVLTDAGHRVVYRADGEEPEQQFYPFETVPDMRWAPSIHMPRKYSRITLEVVGVRVERLNDISRDDAVAEGISLDDDGHLPDPRRAFQSLWESINRAGSWAANPWVWVIEFKRIEAKSEAA